MARFLSRALPALVLQLFLPLSLSMAVGAAPTQTRCSGPGFDDFDFWIGEWIVRWTNEEGRAVAGTNRVRRTLDGCVIVEEFDAGEGGPLKGMSVSVFDARRATWRQTWVDNDASYLDFEGGRVDDGDKRLVLSRVASVNGKPVRQRMVFREVAPDRLTWDWQRSRDDGATWETLWTLRYARR